MGCHNSIATLFCSCPFGSRDTVGELHDQRHQRLGGESSANRYTWLRLPTKGSRSSSRQAAPRCRQRSPAGPRGRTRRRDQMTPAGRPAKNCCCCRKIGGRLHERSDRIAPTVSIGAADVETAGRRALFISIASLRAPRGDIVVRPKSVCSAFSTTSSSCPTLVPVMQSADFGDFDHRPHKFRPRRGF